MRKITSHIEKETWWKLLHARETQQKLLISFSCKKCPYLSNQMVRWSITSVNLTKTVPFTPMQNGIWWIQKYVRSIRLVVHSTYIITYMIHWFNDLHVKSFSVSQYVPYCLAAKNVTELKRLNLANELGKEDLEDVVSVGGFLFCIKL